MVSPSPIISPRNKNGYPIEAHDEAGRQLLRCIRSNRCRAVCHVPAYLFLKITDFSCRMFKTKSCQRLVQSCFYTVISHNVHGIPVTTLT